MWEHIILPLLSAFLPFVFLILWITSPGKRKRKQSDELTDDLSD